MYSPKVTARQIAKAEKKLSQREPGFKVERLSVSDIAVLNKDLYALSDPDKGIFVKPLTNHLRRALLSQRVLCTWDFRYFLTGYHHILPWETGEWTRMQPNIAQNIVLDVMAEQEEQQLSIDLQSLKARQLGITTLSESIIEHRVLFHPNTRAVVGSANPEKSTKMVKMVEDSIERIPFWMLPAFTQHRKNEFLEFGGMGSWLSVYHGSMKSGFARGETPTIGHLSEVAEWLDPEADIDAALMFAMHKGPRRLLILESTAGVIGDWFSRQWKWNRARWGVPGQVARLRPMFLPWFVGRDLYPTKTDEREHPIPKGWKPAALTYKHAESARQYVISDPILKKSLGEAWTMPLEQQWWWEYTREYYKENKQLNDFLRECPSNDVECFSSKFSTVFDAEVIINLRAQAKPPVEMYVLDGPSDEIRDELKPDRRIIDTERAPLIIDGRYTLYPVQQDKWSPMMIPDGIIYMWERPRDGCEYGLGVDTSKGMGQDRSSCEVMRKATVTEVARQVCEFASMWLSANDMPPWTHSMARLYQVKERLPDKTLSDFLLQPKFAIEVANGGDACQLAMEKMGWRNFHNWLRIDKKIIDEGKSNFLGVTMTEWFRDMVFGNLIKAIKDGLIDIDSPWLLEEMSTLEKDEEKRRFDHAPGCNDDRFIGLGIILSSLHALDWEGLKSTFGRGRILTEVQVLGPPKEKVYPRQKSKSPIAQMQEEQQAAKLLWNPIVDRWDGYSSQRFAPKWENNNN